MIVTERKKDGGIFCYPYRQLVICDFDGSSIETIISGESVVNRCKGSLVIILLVVGTLVDSVVDVATVLAIL